MSRNKDRIIKTLKKYGLETEEINWQPLGVDFEMVGREGGWLVRLTNGKIYMGQNIDFLINEIETWEGRHTDPVKKQKYCNHVTYWKSSDHSEGLVCAKCGKEFEDN